jgi:predicted nucleotidyltransferase
MRSGQEILKDLQAKKEVLLRRFSVQRIGLFGSCARGGARPDSDIDILVELSEPTFDHYMDLKFYLEDLLGAPVDLVLADCVKPRLQPIIEREVVYA